MNVIRDITASAILDSCGNLTAKVAGTENKGLLAAKALFDASVVVANKAQVTDMKLVLWRNLGRGLRSRTADQNDENHQRLLWRESRLLCGAQTRLMRNTSSD